MVTATAATGPALATTSASLAGRPMRISSGLSCLRTQNRNATAPTPMITVGRFTSVMLAASERPTSIRLCPLAGTPRMCFSWLAAMIRPEAVMKPEITGWLRKFARKPSRSRPMAVSIRPDSSASTIAAA